MSYLGTKGNCSFWILVAFFCIGSASASGRPCCTDFDERSTEGFAPCPDARNVDVATAGPGQNGERDAYLQLTDRSGASLACGPSCAKDWLEVVSDCGEFCFDVRIVEDSCVDGVDDCEANGGWIPIRPQIQITSGDLRARFRASLEITDDAGPSGGWHRFCAPIGGLEADGSLPSNEDGEWAMLDGSPDQWEQLLSDVDGLILPVDFTSNPAEIVGYDNLCFQPGRCDTSCDEVCCLGACCLRDRCVETTAEFCDRSEGRFGGIDSECGLRLCRAGNLCFPTSATACKEAGGTLLPPGESCPIDISL